jgi:hypothetical protein
MLPLQILTIVIAVLLSSGALAFFLKYSTRLAFAERDATKALASTEAQGKDIAATKERVTLIESTLGDIRNSLSKLNVIDEIKATVNSMKERVDEKLSEMVSRSEHEARWKAQDDQYADLKMEVRDLREKSA